MTAEEPRHQAAVDAAAAADLITHDIDTDDLFALITEAEPELEPQPEADQKHGRPAAARPGQRRRGCIGGGERSAR